MVTCSSTRALSPPATETNQLRYLYVVYCTVYISISYLSQYLYRHDIKHLEEIVSGLVTITDKMNTLSIGVPEVTRRDDSLYLIVCVFVSMRWWVLHM